MGKKILECVHPVLVFVTVFSYVAALTGAGREEYGEKHTYWQWFVPNVTFGTISLVLLLACSYILSRMNKRVKAQRQAQWDKEAALLEA